MTSVFCKKLDGDNKTLLLIFSVIPSTPVLVISLVKEKDFVPEKNSVLVNIIDRERLLESPNRNEVESLKLTDIGCVRDIGSVVDIGVVKENLPAV
jgi:hypothetical protein